LCGGCRAGPARASSLTWPAAASRSTGKRWIRWRLSTGLEAGAGGTRPLRALARFATFLEEHGIAGTSGIDRAVIEDYLADLHSTMDSSRKRADYIGMASAFLTAVRQHGWDPALPATAARADQVQGNPGPPRTRPGRDSRDIRRGRLIAERHLSEPA
jgi:hypothetical protein